MAIIYKDIDDLSQKSTVAGTEKLPVSDTEYLTPTQIATYKRVHLQSESEMPVSPDANTLYLIDETNTNVYEVLANKVTSLSSSSTNTQYPSAKCVYDHVDTIVGNIETLLAAL